jgi:biopolymer transport protein ExbD
MKRLAPLLIMLLVGCATFQKTTRNDFDNAVLNSIEARGDRKDVVIMMASNGTISIGGRPTMLSEISQLRKVRGLPQNHPSVILRADYQALHTDVRACLDELADAGIWKVTFQASKTEDAQHAPPVQASPH